MTNGVSVLPGAHYAIMFLIGGTLLSTRSPWSIAVPVGVGAAIFLAEAVPDWARLWLSLFVELLAAIPSRRVRTLGLCRPDSRFSASTSPRRCRVGSVRFRLSAARRGTATVFLRPVWCFR